MQHDRREVLQDQGPVARGGRRAENPKHKAAFYEEIAKHLPEKTVLTSSSSTLLPSKPALFTDRHEKFLSLYFANVIWVHDTAEVMGHPDTDPAVYQEVMEFSEEIGIVPLHLHNLLV